MVTEKQILQARLKAAGITCEPLLGTKIEPTPEERCNGWTNRETWNVALWIQNDLRLHRLALDCGDFESFRELMAETGHHFTPDRVSWYSTEINCDEIENMFSELLKDYYATCEKILTA